MSTTFNNRAISFVITFLNVFLINCNNVLAQCNASISNAGAVAGDHLGVSVDISGDVAIAGANFHDALGTNSGAAWISRWNGSSWTQEQKLQGLDTAANDEFGRGVAIEGDVAVVVAPGKEVSSNGYLGGATYIFRRIGTTWTQEQKLPVGVNGAPFEPSSASASISGDTIIIGNAKDNTRTTMAGAAYVYRYHPERPAGSRWAPEPLKRNGVFESRLTAADATGNDRFGMSAAVSGDWVVVGAYSDAINGSLSGSAYVFKRNNNGTSDTNDDFWEQQQKLMPADNRANDQFGFSVGIDANIIVIGAPGDTFPRNGFGAAYVYSLLNGTWTEQTELLGSGSILNGLFGSSVAVSGDSVIVGAPKETPFWTYGGSAYLYQKIGSTWLDNAEHRLVDPNAYGNNSFGYAVAASGSRLFAGSINGMGTGVATSFSVACFSQAPTISESLPLNGYIDALEDRNASSQSTLYGIRNFRITFSTPVTQASGSAIMPQNFAVSCQKNGASVVDLQTGSVPTVTQVNATAEPNQYELVLSQRICLGAWTKITAVNIVDAASGTALASSGNSIVFGNLPMDITQDGKVLGDDISRWLGIQNGSYQLPSGLTAIMLLDQKRNGLIAGEDITRGIQLINGIGTFRVWSGFDMGARP